MSPLLFLAIAVVVPLLGMVVLGVSARLKRSRETDDETEPFRRKLESIAPAESVDSPGLMGKVRRRRGTAQKERAATEPTQGPTPAQSPESTRSSEPTPRQRRRRKPRGRTREQAAPADVAVSRPPASTSIRLIERPYSLPALPPMSAEQDDQRPLRPVARLVVRSHPDATQPSSPESQPASGPAADPSAAGAGLPPSPPPGLAARSPGPSSPESQPAVGPAAESSTAGAGPSPRPQPGPAASLEHPTRAPTPEVDPGLRTLRHDDAHGPHDPHAHRSPAPSAPYDPGRPIPSAPPSTPQFKGSVRLVAAAPLGPSARSGASPRRAVPSGAVQARPAEPGPERSLHQWATSHDQEFDPGS